MRILELEPCCHINISAIYWLPIAWKRGKLLGIWAPVFSWVMDRVASEVWQNIFSSQVETSAGNWKCFVWKWFCVEETKARWRFCIWEAWAPMVTRANPNYIFSELLGICLSHTWISFFILELLIIKMKLYLNNHWSGHAWIMGTLAEFWQLHDKHLFT